MNICDIVTPIMDSFIDDELATMALFTAYIDNQIGYEIFCNKLPVKLFNSLKKHLRNAEWLRSAYLASAAFDCGVETYLEKTFEDYGMWCLFLEGTKTIINDPRMIQRLFADDRYFVEGMYSLWCRGMLSEDNWSATVKEFGRNSVLSRVAF